MRVQFCAGQAAGQFADQLLTIGDGKFPINDDIPDVVQLPETMGTFVSNLMNWCLEFTRFALKLRKDHLVVGKLHFGSLNKTTRTINTTLVEQLPGECVQ